MQTPDLKYTDVGKPPCFANCVYIYSLALSEFYQTDIFLRFMQRYVTSVVCDKLRSKKNFYSRILSPLKIVVLNEIMTALIYSIANVTSLSSLQKVCPTNTSGYLLCREHL